MVGIFAFAIDYLLLLFLYYILNVNLEVATASGFIAGFIISFSANKKWVFGHEKQKKRLHRQVIEYSALVVFNFVFTVAAVSFMNNHGIRPTIGKLIVMAIIMCWNYVLFRWIIFVHEKEIIV